MYMRDFGGRVVDVPDDQVEAAQRNGLVPASPAEIAAYQAKAASAARYGTPGQQIITGLEGAADAATLGGFTVLERGLGVPAEDIAGRQEENPTARGVGTLVGTVAPIVASGGLSGGAAAARGALGEAAALTAPGLISRAGRAVTGAVEAALPQATSTLGKMATRAASMGAAGAVEGAGFELGHVVHEAALENPKLTAESVVADLALAGVLGGALGGALGAAEVGIPAAVARARAATENVFGKARDATESWLRDAQSLHGVARSQADVILEHRVELESMAKTMPGVAEKIAEAAPEAAEAIGANLKQFGALEREFPGIHKNLVNARPDTLGVILRNADEFAAFEREFPGALRNLSQAEPSTAEFFRSNWQKLFRPGADAERSALMKAVRQGGDEVLGSIDRLFKLAYGKMLRGGAETLLVDADPAAVVDAYSRFLGKTLASVELMEARPSLFAPFYPAKLRDILADIRKESAETLDPIAAFQHLTRLRQELREMIDWGKAAIIAPSDREAQVLVRQLYGELSDSLRSEAIFGQAGVHKAALDDAFSRWQGIVTRKPGAMLGHSEKGTSNFSLLFMTGGRLNPNKVNQWFNKFGDDVSSLKTEAWSEMLTTARNAVKAVDDLNAVVPTSSFDRAALDSLLARVEGTAANAADRAATQIKYNLLDPRAGNLRGSHAALPGEARIAAEQAAAAVQAASAVASGRAGSTLRMVLSPLSTAVATATNLPRAASVITALEAIGRRVNRAVENGISTLVRGGVKASYVGRGEAAAGISRGFAKSPEEQKRAHERRIETVRSLAGDPEGLHGRIAATTGAIAQHAPQTSAALAFTTATAIAFLQSKVPQPPANRALGSRWEPSRTEIARFQRYYEAVQDPTIILKQAAAGTLSREAVEAVAAVYPELMTRIRSAAIEKAASMKGPVPYQSRLMLAVLLGQDVDGSLEPGGVGVAAQAFYASRGAAAKPPPMPKVPKVGGVGKITLPGRLQTPQQRSSQR